MADQGRAAPGGQSSGGQSSGGQSSGGQSSGGQLEFTQYPNGIGVNTATQKFFFPYKIIQHLSLTRNAEGTTWTLHIRTATDKINLQSSRNLEADFASICMLYH